MRRAFRAPRLGGDQLRVELAGEARDDFVLHVEQVGHRLVEPLGPQCLPVSASMSWTLMRIRLPPR